MSQHDTTTKQRTSNSSSQATNPTRGTGQTNAKRNRHDQRKKNGTFDYSGMNSVSIEQKRSQYKRAIPRVHIKRAIKEVIDDWSLSPEQMRLSPDATNLIHEVAEDYLISVMQASVLCTVHAKRKTTYPSDMRLAKTLLNGQQLSAIRASWKRFIRRKKEEGQDLPTALTAETAEFAENENDDELDVSDEL